MSAPASFQQLYDAYDWREIANCPGRYIARGLGEHISIEELAGSAHQVKTFQTQKARDTVLVLKIEGGGIISYLRADGTRLHTLNTESGFQRKLTDLGIAY